MPPSPANKREEAHDHDDDAPSGSNDDQQQQTQQQPATPTRRAPPLPLSLDAGKANGSAATPSARPSSSSTFSMPIALFYFFYFSSLATFVPFVSLYLRDAAPARLTAAQVGAVASLRPFVSAPAGVFLSALADRRGWHLQLLVAGHALCAIARALLVPFSSTLTGIVAVTVASEALGAPVCVIADAAAVAEAGALGYGSLRLWGAVGWGGASLLSGALLHRGGMGASTAAFLLLAALALPAAARVPCGGIAKKKEEQQVDTTTTTAATSIPQLLRSDPGVALFLAAACLFGVGVGAIGEFLFLHLRDALDAPEWVMGASLAVTCAAEVPAFRLQPRLLRAVGVRGALRLVALAYVVRTGLYAALPSVAKGLLGGGGGGRWLPLPPYVLVLPVEILHGLCFAVAWASGTAFCRRAAPAGREAELQGWFSGCFFGLGQGSGCLIAGALYSRLGGGEGMFAAMSVGLLLGFAVLEGLGVWWPWGDGGAGGGDQEDEEGAWLRGVIERARRRLRPPQYRKLEHKRSDAELAIVGGTAAAAGVGTG